jgi:DNA-binding MarR family transcriptional regulator
MSRVIRSLEKRESSLIKCTINSKDKRKIDVELTKLGRQSHKNYRDARLEGILGYFEVLSSKDCREFMRICRLIRGQMENMLES